MKKVLFATTALVASAGIAAAEVELKGSAEMGIVGGDSYGNEIQFHTDIDVTFSMSGTTDNGLTFGASVDLDEADDTAIGGSLAFGNTTQGGETIFLKGDFGTITMGDTDGGFDWALQEVLVAGGSIDDSEEHGGYSGNSGLDGSYDGQIVRYDNTFGDFGVAISAEIDDTGAMDPVYGLGFKYSADLGGVDLGVGLGFQSGDGIEIWGISVDGSMDNGFGFAINYSDLDVTEHWGIGIGYETGALAIGVNYGDMDGVASGFGLAAAYDLGGGAAIQFGYGNTDVAGGGDVDTFSLGVAMSF